MIFHFVKETMKVFSVAVKVIELLECPKKIRVIIYSNCCSRLAHSRPRHYVTNNKCVFSRARSTYNYI